MLVQSEILKRLQTFLVNLIFLTNQTKALET